MAKHEFGIMMDALSRASDMTSMSRGNMPVFLLMTPIWKALSKGLHPLTSIGIHFPSKAKGLHTVVLHLFHLVR